MAAELRGRTLPGAGTEIVFLQADYTRSLPLSGESFDLLISLYAGPVWDHRSHRCQPTPT